MKMLLLIYCEIKEVISVQILYKNLQSVKKSYLHPKSVVFATKKLRKNVGKTCITMTELWLIMTDWTRTQTEPEGKNRQYNPVKGQTQTAKGHTVHVCEVFAPEMRHDPKYNGSFNNIPTGPGTGYIPLWRNKPKTEQGHTVDVCESFAPEMRHDLNTMVPLTIFSQDLEFCVNYFQSYLAKAFLLDLCRDFGEFIYLSLNLKYVHFQHFLESIEFYPEMVNLKRNF